MCWAMATGLQNQEGVPENHLRKQLAFAVRSIQWSYAIFWSIKTGGVLEWQDGYYNGDIKTRKTMQPMEFIADQMGLQRSEQLRELYESLSAGDTNPQARRPSASLSPEDLTDAEWYYLVCMSFKFSRGQGLPARALENGQSIWLCRAPDADGKVFERSLLAKSASIQTVVCFPFLGGVVELGVTDLVSEDPRLIEQVKTCCLEYPRPNCIEQSASSPQNEDNEEDPVFVKVGHEKTDSMALDPATEFETKQESESPELLPPSYIPQEEITFHHDGIEEFHANICDEIEAGSPHDSSNGCGVQQHTEDSFMLEGVNGGASQVQSWQFLDDEFSNCMLGSMNSSDCISQTLANPQNVVSSPKGEKINNIHLQELQECNDTKLSSLDLGTDDLHYSRTLSAIFKNSHSLIVAPHICRSNHKSSFTNWREGPVDPLKTQIGTPQKILKKILFEVAWMHGGNLIESPAQRASDDGLWKLEGDDVGANHVLSERRRREKLKEKFHILKSLVAPVGKVDKASILGDTIEYLKELERRVEELESCRELAEYEARARRKHPDIAERTSDNYGHTDIANDRKTTINKRKASDIDESELELDWVSSKDGLAANLTVVMNEKEVLIELRCPWRECLLLDILDAISNLNLDAHTVQSSTLDGNLILTIKSKFKGVAVASAGMIKQALQRVMGTC
ncbi:transcription factor EGL1-like [Macadamia integrifolia]|uniref:transcription factor EGL1-like n=1 Tax=Macadamia integrifolia TaxID=60698 RepID=UPI001C4F1B81|nr:transcription factor EGL1-like [Macadamia integrifolia]